MEVMTRPKRDLPMIIAAGVAYICFLIATFAHATFWIHLFEPITGILTGLTIVSCLSRMGRFWMPSLLLAIGVFCYAIADALIFIENYILHSNNLELASTIIFLFPNYLFGASVGVYFLQKLKGRELYQFLINTLVVTTIGFLAFRRVLIFLGSYELLSLLDLIRIYLYFFINLFIIIMIAHMYFMVTSETGIKGINAMILGIVGFILLDIPYTYVQAVGGNPENEYANLVYMLCMMLMAHGIYHQAKYQHVFKIKPYEYHEKATKRTRFAVFLASLISLTLLITKVIEQTEFFCLLLVILAFWITTATFQNAALGEQILKQQDILTGLYNRRYIATLLSESVKKAQDQGKKFAAFCVDLNNFKPINDTYGHEMGDRVLKEFGSRMLALPAVYTSFRTGGDEFLIVRDDIETKDEMEEAAKKLQQLFHSPISLDSYVFSLSGSIGASIFPDDTTDTDMLLRYSDAAMYSIKHSQNKDDFRFFDTSLVETVEKHNRLEKMLRDSDPARDFVLHYQPRVDADSEKLIAAEVFPRLVGESGYTAADILPIAEEVGLMNRLGNWITETAIAQLKAWNTEYNADLSISINLSPLQLVDNNFLVHLKNVTGEYGIEPGKIHLDISNDAVMGSSITAKETLRSLKDYGFMLSLNDFGGYDINLSHILTCGFTDIDISPSLIWRADREEDANVLIKTIIGLAKTMDISANAVGIENRQQADKLKSMGVMTLQGYYFGYPLEAEKFTDEFMKKRDS